MDSLSQAVLGAAVAVGVMQPGTVVWKAASWGAVGGTLPDLDVLLDHGDPILDMVLHRAETHSLFWLTLFSLPLALAVARLQGQWPLWKRWWLALWLVLGVLLALVWRHQGLAADQVLLRITDLRMGQHPTFAFAFHVAERKSAPVALSPARAVGQRPDLTIGLPWLWRRMWGEQIRSPT